MYETWFETLCTKYFVQINQVKPMKQY